MANLAEIRGQAVNLDVHALKDIHFKKPLTSTSVQFELDAETSNLMNHIKIYRGAFKINATDVKSALFNFLQTANKLNHALGALGTKPFAIDVVNQVHAAISKVEETFRNEDGNPPKPFEYKYPFKVAVERNLESAGFSKPRCNIGNGTLFEDDFILINSGLTYPTNLSSGLLTFLGFVPDSIYLRQYKILLQKFSYGFEEGTWLNKTGDKPILIAYELQLYSALYNFLIKMEDYSVIDLQEDTVFEVVFEEVTTLIDSLQAELNGLIEQKILDKQALLSSELVKSDASFQEITNLGLGKAALDKYYEREVSMVLLNHIATLIGASHVAVVDLQKVIEVEEAGGRSDEFWSDHLELPNKAVRAGMSKLKALLDSGDPLVSLCFEKDKLFVNATASFDIYTDNNGITVESEQEFLQIHSGISYPIVDEREVIRFSFKG